MKIGDRVVACDVVGIITEKYILIKPNIDKTFAWPK